MTKISVTNLIKKFNQIEKKTKSLFKCLGIEKYITNIDNKNENLFDLKSIAQKDFRIALIADRFTTDCFLPECNIIELIPNNFKQQIESFNPDLVFLESAWEGKDKLWYKKVANGSSEIFELIDFAKSKNIPVILWNKEDPVYTDQFMPVAQKVDFIFTTDLDSVLKYKNEVGHNRVYHLHFAAQPKLHNPIEKYDRKNKACFAGAYYHRYPRRIKVFDSFAKVLIDGMGLDIYDRNYKNARPEHAFPKTYDKYILGKLDPSEIDIAYKSYDYGINMNSIQQSQTMFARRVFELMASNTVVIGNYSRGVKNYFGDLTICTDDANELKYRLDKYCANDESKYQYRLLGLRAVLKEHLYEDRLDFIIKKVFGKSIKPNPIHIDVFSYVKNQNQFNKVLAMFNKQSYQNKSLTILSDIELENNNNDIKIIKSDNNFTVENMFSNSYISYFEANNFYGENYLLDFALSLRYTNFDAIGKSDFYIMDDNGSFNVPNFNNSYKKVDALKPHSSMLDSNYYGKLSISNIIDNITINDGDLFSADQFNYCINCSCDNPSSDAEIEDIGISLDKINKISSSIITNAVIKTEKTFDIRPLEVEKTIFDKPEKINLIKTVQGLTISSNLDNEEYSCAQYNNDFYSVKPFLVENKLSVLFEGIGDLSILGSCVFYENKKEVFKVDNIIFNTTQKIVIPTNVNKVQFGIKVIGSGSFIFNKAIMGENYLDNDEIYFVSRNENLLISDSYPHYENEILDYPLKKIQDLFIGKTYDVVCVNNFSKNGFREYKGINVFETHEKQLIEVLNNINTNKNIVVYTLNKEIENIVKKYNSNFKILTENNEILND